MKFGDEELTGKELGPVRFTFNNDAARQHIGLARRYLGDMKQRMQLGNLGQLYEEKTLKDGSIIRMWSNKNGSADIDLIDIISPESYTYKIEENFCLGFIIKTITNQELVGYECTFKIELPGGDEFNLDTVRHPSTFGADYTTINGFHDNGAKYVDVQEIGEVEDIFTGVYQHVSTVLVTSTSSVQGFGPITFNWTPHNEGSDPFYTSLNAGYSLETSYAHDEGSCGFDAEYGTDVTWSVTVDPCHFYYKLNMDLPPDSSTDPAYYGGTYIQKQIFYSGGYDWLSLPLFPDRCVRAPNQRATSTGLGDPGDYVVNWNENETLVKNTWDAAADIGYNEWLGYYIGLYEYTTPFYLSNLASYPNSGGFIHRPGEAYRRTDGRGFFSRSGLKFNNSFLELTERGYEHGDNVFFMVPTGTNNSFIYSQAIIDAFPLLNYENTSYETNVGLPGVPSDLEFIDPDCSSGSGPGYGNTGGISHNNADNVSITQGATWEPTGAFGVPINVPWGEYKVTLTSLYDVKADIEVTLYFTNKVLKFTETIDPFAEKKFSIFVGAERAEGYGNLAITQQ